MGGEGANGVDVPKLLCDWLRAWEEEGECEWEWERGGGEASPAAREGDDEGATNDFGLPRPLEPLEVEDEVAVEAFLAKGLLRTDMVRSSQDMEDCRESNAGECCFVGSEGLRRDPMWWDARHCKSGARKCECDGWS